MGIIDLLIDKFEDFAQTCDEQAAANEHLTPEYWRGWAASMRHAAQEVRAEQRRAWRERAPVEKGIQRVLDRWLMRSLDVRNEALSLQFDNRLDESQEMQGRLDGYLHAWRELSAILEYLLSLLDEDEVEDG
jgi:hypothetical protein